MNGRCQNVGKTGEFFKNGLTLLVLVIILSLISTGCVQNPKNYVCSDGSVVSTPTKCVVSCEGNGQDYCSGNTYKYNGRCIDGEWQYSQKFCDYSCSPSGCGEKPKTEFDITSVEYNCLSKAYSPSGGGLYIVSKNIWGLEESSAYGGITDIRIAPASGASLPDGTWNLSVRVYKSDSTKYFETCGEFRGFMSIGDSGEYSIFDISDFISAPYTERGSVEVIITSPEGVIKEETISVPSEGCAVSTFSAQELLDLVGEELTDSKIARNVDMEYDYDTGKYKCEGDYSKIELRTTDRMDGNPDGSCNYAWPFSLRSDYCTATYKSYGAGSCAKVGTLMISSFYYDNLAPSIARISNELKSRAAEDDSIHYSTMEEGALKLENLMSEGNRIYWIFCKNKAWIKIDMYPGDNADNPFGLNEDEMLEQAVRNIAEACENS